MLTVALFLPLAGEAAPAQARREIGTEVRLDFVLSRYAEYGFNGVILVARKGQVVLERGYGLANRERGIPNTPATLFEMNSLTKPFTAAAVLQLEAAGKLKTTDSIGRYLGEMPAAKLAATIDQLATHTAGLVPEGTELDESSRTGFINSVKQVPPESPPGEAYRYTNAGYSLLAAIVEIAGREPFDDYLRRNFFRPAGLRNTGFRKDFESSDPRLAVGYGGTPAAYGPEPPNAYTWGTIGAGGVVSTVRDMYLWLKALQGEKILSAAQRRKMFQPRPEPREGYGWHVEADTGGIHFIHKGGGSRSFASQILYFPREDLTIVWASNNLVQRWRQTLNRSLPAALSGDSVSLPPRIVGLDRKVLEQLAGTYSDDRGNRVELRAKEHYLYAQANSLSIPIDVMFLPQSPRAFTSFNPQSREITSLAFQPSGNTGSRAVFALPSGQRLTLIRD